MASYYSPDLFLENIYIVVIFLNDGEVTVVPQYDSKGRIHESGDLVHIGGEPAVILGWSEECEAEAVEASRTYFRRLAKYHGHEEDLSKFRLLGHDVARSEILFGDQRTNTGSGSDSDADGSKRAKQDSDEDNRRRSKRVKKS